MVRLETVVPPGSCHREPADRGARLRSVDVRGKVTANGG